MKTKNNIYFITAFICLLFSAPLFSQENKAKSSPFLDNQKEIKPLNLSLIDTTKKNSILSFKPKQFLFGFKPSVNKYFDPSNATKKKPINFMTTPQHEDDDVLVKRSFEGKDTSNNLKLSTHYNLGTLYSTSASVRIEVRDYGLVDGDRIKVYVNKQLINSNIMLNGLNYIIQIDLNKGYNRIDVEAINEGYSGPNTAAIKVYDEKGHLLSAQEWNILAGQRATLGVVRN